MNDTLILKEALVERQEYLEDLIVNQKLIRQQIKIVQHDVDELLLKIMQSSKWFY